MKRTFVLIAVAAIALVACTKEQPFEDQTPAPTVLSIGSHPDAQADPAEAPTRTTLGPAVDNQRQIYWANDDQVCVSGVVSEKLTGITKNTVTRADFSFPSAIPTPYQAVYPATIWKNSSTVTLPLYAKNSIFPLGGKSDSKSFSLNTLTSGLCITVKRAATDPDTDNIALVEVSSPDHQLSGDFAIDWDNATLTETAATGDNLKVRLTSSWSTSSKLTFYIPLPAGTYGISVKVMDVNGHYMVKNTTSAKNFIKGSSISLPEFAFVPDETETGIEIDSAEKLIAFAQAYNNGDYKELGAGLVATITDDITFDATTSAAFNATKGIGLKIDYYGDAEDYYFDGCFKGNNHTISGLQATVPLFKATSAGSIIKDFTLDNTCSYTFTHSKVAELDAGAVVGYHRGTLKNVDVAADVSLAAVASVNKVTVLGGLVGRAVVGSIDDCTYSGAIAVPAGFQAADRKIYIGGLVGWISNAGGKVVDSGFEGTIENEGQMIASGTPSDDFKNNPQLMIGGIIGLNTGTIDNCTVANNATGVTVILNDGSDHSYSGTVVTHSTNAYHYAIAGIAGRNDGTVKDCTNDATVLNIFSAARGDDDINGRYLEVGGIVGYNAPGKTVSGSTNNGSIINRATPKMQRIGGVVGWNHGTVSASKNTATGAIGVATAHQSPYSARQLYLGGVIGHLSAGTVTNVQNAGALTVSRLEGNDAMTFIGGVMGKTDSDIDGGASKLISNSGNILQSHTCGRIPVDGYNLGGIVGYATKAISNVSNTGNVQYSKTSGDTGTASAAGFNLGGVVGKTLAAVSSSTNSGRVYMANSSTGASTTGGYNLGGIAGVAGLTITGCSNSGKVDYAVTVALAYTAGFNIGGIAGVNNGAVSTSPNSGEVYFANTSTGSAAGGYNIGGIVGAVNADITDSDNTGYIHHTHSGAAATTNIHIGGVAGYMTTSATISGCDNDTSETVNSGTVYISLNTGGYAHTQNSIGGILGATSVPGVNATLANCTNAGKIYGGVNKKQNGRPLYVGGIVAYLAGKSSLDNCDNSGEVLNDQANNTTTAVGATYNGGVVGYAKGTSDGRITLKNCDNTSANMHSRRGIVGGIVGYAEYADFTSCTFNQSIPDDGVNLCYWIGGIVSWADNCTLTSCTYSGAQLSGTQVQPNGVGGMAAQLTNSTVDGCSSSIETMRTNLSGSWADVAGGAIVGVSGSGNTIQNCHYKPTINGAESNIAGTGTFTDGGGNAADL